MLSSDSVNTPLLEKSKLDEDLQGNSVDATLYRCMIGSLMYLTSSRPDLAYAVCLYARYQAKPTEKHLNAFKQIFRYLKGSINMGLWYSKDTGDKLVSWPPKKQKCTAISSTEAEYIALSNMNTTQAQQKALDDALVTPSDRLEFEKCNMRLKTGIKRKEVAFQVVLVALALIHFYRAFLITVDVPAIYMHEF
nr:hypothetical protein [Tanacetum cinerariifolium]